VPRSIVLQREQLPIGVRQPPEPLSVTKRAVGVLVEIISEVQHQVEIGAGSDQAIHAEEPCGVVRTGQHGEAGSRGTLAGQRLGAAHERTDLADAEVIIIGRVRIEPNHVHLGGEVARLRGLDRTGDDDEGQLRVRRHAPVELDTVGHGAQARGGRRHARPQDDGVRQRVAAGHAVLEGARPAALLLFLDERLDALTGRHQREQTQWRPLPEKPPPG
jgi:hypothetical protein